MGSDTLAPDCPPFRLVDFNPRRAARRAPAARVQVSEDACDWLWMSKRDLSRNIAAFGPHPELLRAQESYRQGREVTDAR